MFVDEVVFLVKAGDGGNGCVSFRREKFIPYGGPDGGDGGHGGNIILKAKKNLASLTNLKRRNLIKAKTGHQGQGRNKSGKDGEDTVIEVPVGTVCIDFESSEIICDLTKSEETYIIAQGGKGGKGNTHFKSATNQAPKFAQPGEEGEERKIKLELKLIADVGLVGFPNAGKSTLLSSITRANPKIAAYPFTTLYPNLGVVYVNQLQQFIIADIPGLIEGAHEGAGLGIRFLKHIERTGLLLFVIDIFDENKNTAYKALLKELESFNPKMLEKPRVIAINKIDLIPEDEQKEKINEFKKNIDEDIDIFTISGATGINLHELKKELFLKVSNLKK